MLHYFILWTKLKHQQIKPGGWTSGDRSWESGNHRWPRRRAAPAGATPLARERRASGPAPLPRPLPVPARSLRASSPLCRVPADARQKGSRCPRAAFHTYVSGRGSCPKTSGQVSDISRVHYRAALSPDRSRSWTVFELTTCGRYSGLIAEENIINGETRQLLSLTGG